MTTAERSSSAAAGELKIFVIFLFESNDSEKGSLVSIICRALLLHSQIYHLIACMECIQWHCIDASIFETNRQHQIRMTFEAWLCLIFQLKYMRLMFQHGYHLTTGIYFILDLKFSYLPFLGVIIFRSILFCILQLIYKRNQEGVPCQP